MPLLLKALASLLLILLVTGIGRKYPALAGMITVMPLVGLLAMVWMHLETKGAPQVMLPFTRGMILGLLPTLLFFAAAFAGYRKALPLPWLLAGSFGAWFLSAWFLQRFILSK